MNKCFGQSGRVVLLILMFSIISCGTIDTDSIVGEWVPVKGSPMVLQSPFLKLPLKLEQSPTLVFWETGKFKGQNIPELFFANAKSRNIVSFEGRWNNSANSGNQRIELEVLKLNGEVTYHQTSINISRGVSEIELFFWVGEPGNSKFSFKK